MAAMRKILIVIQFLPFMRAINLRYFPCETDDNVTTVDCCDRQLSYVPSIKATSVKSIDLSRTKLHRVTSNAFDGVPQLETLKMMDNCQPGKLRSLKERSCKVDIDKSAFKNLMSLKSLYLSGNSLSSIPLFPKNLTFLDLQNNCIFSITESLGTPYLGGLLLSKNCFYANPCNQSFYISKEVFRQLPQLKILTLGYNNLTTVPRGLPPSLKKLDLSENRITEILDGAFSNLTALTSLDMQWNCRRCDHAARPCFPCPNNLPLALHPNSFYANKSLIEFLSLRGNSLTTFPQGMFTPLRHLKRLDLSDNLLAYAICNGTFFGELRGLHWISLIYNYQPLKTFPELILSPYMSNMSELQNLLLTGNFFHTVSKQSLGILSSLKELKVLEMRMNFISSCNLTSLKQLQHLSKIDLSQNMLSFFSSCSNSSAQIVAQEFFLRPDLKTNHYHGQSFILRHRDDPSESDTWESNKSITQEVVDENLSQDAQGLCHENSEYTLWHFRDEFCKKWLTFDLSQNDILSLSQHVFKGMEKVVCLDLSFNYMNQALRGGVFNCLENVVFLNLSYNRLDLYYGDAFSELNSTLKLLDISNNEFHFKMRGMGHRFDFLKNLGNLEVLSLANNEIGMRIDRTLASSSLKYLYFGGNHLDIMWQLDNNIYTNFFKNLTNLIYLDISNNGLKSVPPEVLINLPRSLQALSISGNQLNYFPWQNISALSNLCYLNLSHNYLTYILHSAVDFGSNFSILDLSHNHFSFLTENFFNKAHSLKYLYLSHNLIKMLNQERLPAPFRNGSALVQLTLSANPFKCDCDTSWFSDYLRTTSVKIPHLTTGILCEFPESQQGQSVLSIDRRSCQDIEGSLAFVVCSFLALVFTIYPLLHHLYGWDLWYCLQVLWAGHKGYSQLAGGNSQYLYDAYVVFDSRDEAVRDWVYNELTVNLENLGHRRFCLCLEERDWIPGLSCIDNLHNAVHKSLKTVFVLSRGVTGSAAVPGVIRQAFFMVQQRLLDEKVDAAVLVQLDEMFPKLKYLQLRKRLCRKSVLSWPRNPRAQPLFWNRMRMALSSDNLMLYDDKMSESFTYSTAQCI